MKLATLFLVGTIQFVSAAEKKVPPRHPLQRLDRLVQFSDEILKSDAFKVKSKNWIQMWTKKFGNNAKRMGMSFNRGNQRCGFYDET